MVSGLSCAPGGMDDRVTPVGLAAHLTPFASVALRSPGLVAATWFEGLIARTSGPSLAAPSVTDGQDQSGAGRCRTGQPRALDASVGHYQPRKGQPVTGEYPERDRQQIDAGRLWAAGAATAVVAALVATVGILIARGLLRVAIFAPKGDGVWGNANTITYAVGSGTLALIATGVLHFLLQTTPQATVFFGWIMVLLTVVAVVIPLTVIGAKTEMIATTVLDLLLGLITTTLLINAASGARARVRRPYRQPAYETREWQR